MFTGLRMELCPTEPRPCGSGNAKHGVIESGMLTGFPRHCSQLSREIVIRPPASAHNIAQ